MNTNLMAGYKSIKEAMDILGCSRGTILRYIKKGTFHNVVYPTGFVGRPTAYIPEKQVYQLKKLREAGVNKIYVIPSDEPKVNEELKKKVTELDEAMDAIIMQLWVLQSKVDALKEMYEREG